MTATELNAPKDTRFNAARIPASDKAKKLVDNIRGQLLNYEAHFALRKRARRPVDQQIFDRIVTAIVCDLAHAALVDPTAWRYISLSKRGHAQDAAGAPFMTETRIKIIELMAKPEMDWLELHKAEPIRNAFGAKRSTIRASTRLRRLMEECKITFEDLGRDPALMGDPIVLRGPKVKGKPRTLTTPQGEPAATFRAEMLRVNAWLTNADITCDMPDKQNNARDAGDRWLRRIFNNGRFDEGGRLYGGFWQSMSKEARLKDLVIDQEPVVSLDFGQCAIHIAYAQQRVRPPAGDLYAVPGLEEYREGVKALLNALLHSPKPLSRFPRGTRKWFPKHYRVEDVAERVFSHHSPIRPLLHAGFGMRGVFNESRVLVRSLLDLMEHGVVALPIHDCLVVPIPATGIARAVMKANFRKITGALADVEVDVDCTHLPPGIDLSSSIPTIEIRSPEALELGRYLSEEDEEMEQVASL